MQESDFSKNEESGKLQNLNDDDLRKRMIWVENLYTSKQDEIQEQEKKINKLTTKLQKMQNKQDDSKACLRAWEKTYSDIVSEWNNRLYGQGKTLF